MIVVLEVVMAKGWGSVLEIINGMSSLSIIIIPLHSYYYYYY